MHNLWWIIVITLVQPRPRSQSQPLFAAQVNSISLSFLVFADWEEWHLQWEPKWNRMFRVSKRKKNGNMHIPVKINFISAVSWCTVVVVVLVTQTNTWAYICLSDLRQSAIQAQWASKKFERSSQICQSFKRKSVSFTCDIFSGIFER